ncbi:MAG: UDP-3-O-(3-hydroxymyristoyl)glucosamine N-acyltransferase [Acidobacteriota bacterium]|nr:MAG: UDP-3-O-(3-hydroxymyristoyl)glucosamine N-acyltransferase [Acidobacteriota bacterium]
MALLIREIAQLVDGELSGDGEQLITSAAALSEAGPGQLAFIGELRNADSSAYTSAGCLIVPKSTRSKFEGATIAVDNPKFAFAKAASALHPRKDLPAGIHPTAEIADSAEISEGVFVGAFCFVGENSVVGSGTHLQAGARVGSGVRIGKDCTIHPGVTIEDGAVIGSRVVLKAGAVIGSKGFGFVRDGELLIKFPQIGTVVIEDDVEIGANSCVDRGALGETRIGAGTKIDNLVQIAHNVQIGKRVVIAALSGVSGSVVIGDDCVVGGQVGFADHTTIESGAVIGAKSAVFPGKQVRKGVWAGIPVIPLPEYKRLNAHIRSLPKLRKEVQNLGELVNRLESLFRGRK